MRITINTDSGEIFVEGELVTSMTSEKFEHHIQDDRDGDADANAEEFTKLGEDRASEELYQVQYRRNNPDDEDFETVPRFVNRVIGEVAGFVSKCWDGGHDVLLRDAVFDSQLAAQAVEAATKSILQEFDPGDVFVPDTGCDEEGPGPEEGWSLVEEKAGHKFSARNWQAVSEVQHEEIVALRTIVDAQNALLRIRGGMDS